MTKNYSWWKSQKPRVRKKYTLFLGRYLSPKEAKQIYKKLITRRGGKRSEPDRHI